MHHRKFFRATAHTTLQLCNESLVYRESFVISEMLRPPDSCTRRRHGFSPERLTIFPVFHFSSFFFLTFGGVDDLFSSPVCSWTEMVACSPCCGVFCSLWSLFNCSKIEFLDFPFDLFLQLATWTNVLYFTQFPSTKLPDRQLNSRNYRKENIFNWNTRKVRNCVHKNLLLKRLREGKEKQHQIELFLIFTFSSCFEDLEKKFSLTPRENSRAIVKSFAWFSAFAQRKIRLSRPKQVS